MTQSPALVLIAGVTLLSSPAPIGDIGLRAQTRSWTFEQLLVSPTADELQRVDAAWARKARVIDKVALVGTTTVPVGSDQFEARLYSHTLNGTQRCGAILLPPGAARASLAGLVDIGDIRWDYPDRNLTNGPYVANILGDSARNFALIVPCSRGTGLRIGSLIIRAEGDRRDAWEGVAEDAMAFLTVALSITPQVDPDRLGAYGYSRGGGVALIVGERDSRVRAVLDFAGPTDWFSAMGRPGVDWPRQLEQAAGNPALRPDTRESQFLDFFVRDRDTLALSELRRRLIAASPLYFAEKLPAFQVHHGQDDTPVPVRNATAIRDRLTTPASLRRVFIYAGAGHSLDKTEALTTARAFLLERLGK
jgi:hypothetical protein